MCHAGDVMGAGDVITVLDALEVAGVCVWVDGGWGVDALVDEQSRRHDDLDLVVSCADSELTMRSLRDLGFELDQDERPTRFVMRDDHDHRIDLHPVSFDDAGDGYQVLPDGSRYRYAHDDLSGTGRIGDRTVRCLTAEAQVACHRGYGPGEDDRHDMALLGERFHLSLPPPYRPTEADR
jgi:lincosamide nucleotidyltransferase A/C/D/E